MRARDIGNPKRAGEGPEVPTTFGLTFLKGAWVDITDPVAIRKLSNNPFFEVDKGSAPSGQPGKQPATPVVPDEIPADWQKAHHSTRLKWARGFGATVANVQEADAFLAERMKPQAVPATEPVVTPAASIADPPTGGDDDWSDLDP